MNDENPPIKHTCMVIGTSVSKSLSPQMHSYAYKHLGLEKKYSYVAQNVTETQLPDFIVALKSHNMRGVSVTSPHKVSIANYLDKIDQTAIRIGAVNTVVNTNGVLTGYNSDWIGIVAPLEKKVDLNNIKVAVIGAGGAAQAAVYGLTRKKAKVTLFNRTLQTAQKTAKKFGIPYTTLENINQIMNYDIIINTIPKIQDEKVQPAESIAKYLRSDQILFDITYGPNQTELPRLAKDKGLQIINGLEMLAYQGQQQFKLFTGFDVSVEILFEALSLKEKGTYNYAR